MEHYHNSTNQLEGYVLEQTKHCKSQEDKIEVIFEAFGKLSPSEVWKKYISIYYDTPLTSIRRAISNLKFDDKVVKLEEQKTGVYGRPEHYYTLSNNQLELL